MEFIFVFIFGLIGSVGLHQYFMFKGMATSIPGILIDYTIKRSNKNGRTFSPKVKYLNPNDGKEEIFISSFSSSFKPFQIGEKVELLILGNNTTSIRLKWKVPIILFSIFLLVGVSFFIFLVIPEYSLFILLTSLVIYAVIHFLIINFIKKHI